MSDPYKGISLAAVLENKCPGGLSMNHTDNSVDSRNSQTSPKIITQYIYNSVQGINTLKSDLIATFRRGHSNVGKLIHATL